MIVESNSLQIIYALKEASINLSDVGPIVEDAKSMMFASAGVYPCHVHAKSTQLLIRSLFISSEGKVRPIWAS